MSESEYENLGKIEDESNGDPSETFVELFGQIYEFITHGFYEWKESLEEILAFKDGIDSKIKECYYLSTMIEKTSTFRIGSALDDYFKKRESALIQTYGTVGGKALFDGEKRMIEENRATGHLEKLEPGQDIMECISTSIKRGFVNPESGIVEITQEQVNGEIEALGIGVGIGNTTIVGMYDFATVTTDKNQQKNLFTCGLFGCTGVVIVTRHPDTSYTSSLFHYSPITFSRFCHALSIAGPEHGDGEHCVIAFPCEGTETDFEEKFSIPLSHNFPKNHFVLGGTSNIMSTGVKGKGTILVQGEGEGRPKVYYEGKEISYSFE